MGVGILSFSQILADASSPSSYPSLHHGNVVGPYGFGGEVRRGRGPQQWRKTPLWAANCSLMNPSTSGLHPWWFINSF